MARVPSFPKGMFRTPTYNSWLAMRRRCYEVVNNRYQYYGAKGIKVCERWMKFNNFLTDMGLRPEGKSIGRIDSTKDYSPDNCRWEDKYQQSNNKGDNVLLTVFGKTQTRTQWGREFGVEATVIRDRMERYGWTVEQAILHPLDNTRSAGRLAANKLRYMMFLYILYCGFLIGMEIK